LFSVIGHFGRRLIKTVKHKNTLTSQANVEERRDRKTREGANMMLEYPFYRQSTDYTCGPTCLKMVFKKHAIKKGELTLARNARTEVQWGTQHSGMISTALKHGFFCFVRWNGKVADLREFVRKGYAVIIDWTEPRGKEGHYSLLIGFNKTHVIYHDPWWGKKETMRIRTFISHWHEDGSKNHGWMMILGKHPIPTHLKGKHYYPRT